MIKRIIPVLICIALLIALLPSFAVVETNAVSSYNPLIALNYAAQYWNDGQGLCAEFVSRCLRAGGCDSYNTSCTTLVGLLRNRTDCQEYTFYINEDRTVSIDNQLDKIAPGDPMFFHCGYQHNYQHALLCNGMDEEGHLKAFAHNMANDGSHAIRYGIFCPECHTASIDYLTVFHFDTTPPKLAAWVSDSQMGKTPTQLFAGNPYYLCYKLYDEQTGIFFDSFQSVDYKVTAEIYNPDGSLLCSNAYRNDNNWVSVLCPSAGTYTYKVTITGKVEDTVTGSFDVKASPVQLSAKTKNETLDLTENTSKTVQLSTHGFYTNPLAVKLVDGANGAFSAKLDTFENQTVTISLQAKSVGKGTVTVLLSDAITSELLDAETINVSVTGTEAKITFDANSGTGAPDAQRAFVGQELLLSTQRPTGNGFKVSFNANGGEISKAEKLYSKDFIAWNTKADGSGDTYLPGQNISVTGALDLYAQYAPCVFECSTVPTRDGYSFAGWYDSKELDSYGAPTGKYYTTGNEIDGDLTLYAMWSASPDVLFGDLNRDGIISDADLSKLNSSISEGGELDSLSAFLADINADGKADADDVQLLKSVLDGEIARDALPAYSADMQISVGSGVKTEYAYGEKLSIDNLSLVISYAPEKNYCVTENLSVSGFDPNQPGEQTLLVSCGQYFAEYSVTVKAPEFLLSLDAAGGTVENGYTRVTYGCAIGELPIPLRPGYTFAGWSLNPNQGTIITSETAYTELSDQTAYACWKEGCSDTSHVYEKLIVAPTCTEKGYTAYICKACGQGYHDSETAVTLHSFAEGYCTLCGQTDPSYVQGVCDGKTHCPGAAFTDFPKAAEWSHAGIDFCLEKGLFNGESPTLFSPNKTMTRAMLVTVLYRMEGTPAVKAGSPFYDVSAAAWYRDAVIWAAENGIVNGMEGNQFCPDNVITREQLATILFRYASYKNYDTSAEGNLKSYPDERFVGAWAYKALAWATGAGLINGNGRATGSYLDPQASATRAQTATILMRFIQNICK